MSRIFRYDSFFNDGNLTISTGPESSLQAIGPGREGSPRTGFLMSGHVSPISITMSSSAPAAVSEASSARSHRYDLNATQSLIASSQPHSTYGTIAASARNVAQTAASNTKDPGGWWPRSIRSLLPQPVSPPQGLQNRVPPHRDYFRHRPPAGFMTAEKWSVWVLREVGSDAATVCPCWILLSKSHLQCGWEDVVAAKRLNI